MFLHLLNKDSKTVLFLEKPSSKTLPEAIKFEKRYYFLVNVMSMTSCIVYKEIDLKHCARLDIN